MFDRLKDYFAQFTALDYEQKRNLIAGIVAIVLIATPFGIMRHYDNLASQNQQITTTNKNEARDLLNSAKHKTKKAEIRRDNAPQMYAKMTKNIDKFTKAQEVLMDYNYNHALASSSQHEAALDTVLDLAKTDTMDSPSKGLIVNIPDSHGLKITTSITPKISIYTQSVPVTFHYDYKGKPVYVVTAYYDLELNKLSDFEQYSTEYTLAWNLGKDITKTGKNQPKRTDGTDKKTDKNVKPAANKANKK